MPLDLPGLTGLRGVLALAVLLYHLGYLPGGWLAVDGFFLLSGIVLTHVYGGALALGVQKVRIDEYGRRRSSYFERVRSKGMGGDRHCSTIYDHMGSAEAAIRRFLWHRFARLAPTCIASTLIVVAVGWAQGVHFTSGDVLATLAVLPLIGHKSAVNGAMWSLAVEGVLYAAFPLLLLAMPRNRTVRRAAITVCALGAAVVAWKSFAGHGFVAGPLAVLRGLFPFVAGMLICGSMPLSVAEPGSPQSTRSRRTGAGHHPLHFLDSRPLRWLGEVSLPLYLCQIVPLRLIGHSLWVIPAAIGLAAAVHYAVEVPGRRWLRSVNLTRLSWEFRQ